MGLCREAMPPPAQPPVSGADPSLARDVVPSPRHEAPRGLAVEGVGVPAPRPALKDTRKGVCWPDEEP